MNIITVTFRIKVPDVDEVDKVKAVLDAELNDKKTSPWRIGDTVFDSSLIYYQIEKKPDIHIRSSIHKVEI